MKRALFLLFSCFTLCFSAAVARADSDQFGLFEVDANGFVKDRYSIGFVPRIEGETPLVPLPRPEDRLNPPPFGQIPSWVDKAAIGRALNLDGEVLTVWMSSNAIYVRMSAAEAARISADPRVRYVEQDRMGLVADQTTDTQPPNPLNFRNDPELSRTDSLALRLPFVDQYRGIPGLYQNATIEYLPQTNMWRLSGYTPAEPIAEIEDVEVIVTDEVPAQVFFEITGTFPTLCPMVGEATSSRLNNAFTVYVFYQPGSNEPGKLCLTATKPFRKVVPLDVYGLTAGSYAWNVNGEFSGTFTLGVENILE